MRYCIIVGEASADLHGSRLIAAIKERDAEASFLFMGGDLMAREVGTAPIVHYSEVAYMGILPVLRNLSTIQHAARRVQESMLAFAPDVVIPVDFASFNFQYILPFVKQALRCPIHYYIPPKLWAWKPWRIRPMRRYVDLLLCILPFEADYFGSRGVEARYVGNPCVDATLEARAHPAERKAQIALLSGSRKQELRSNLPWMLQSAAAYERTHKLVVAGAPGLSPDDYAPYLKDYPEVELRFGATYRIVQESRVALVTSGTATLETALLGTPQIVLYRMGGQRVARWAFDHLFRAPYFSLVNLILNRTAVPELIGAEVSTARLEQHLEELLSEGPARAAQLRSIEELRNVLGTTRTSHLAADMILDHLKH